MLAHVRAPILNNCNSVTVLSKFWGALHGFHFLTAEKYTEMVRKLFSVLEKANPEKQRLYAVCITKADLIQGGIFLHPDALIETFIGREMSDALNVPKKGMVQTFTTSSFGFFPGTFRPNFDPEAQRIIDKEHWQPYGCPFADIFSEIANYQSAIYGNNSAKHPIYGGGKLGSIKRFVDDKLCLAFSMAVVTKMVAISGFLGRNSRKSL